MGFALWIGSDTAWAKGTSEYRALGSAAVALTDLFQQRDFSPKRRIPVSGAVLPGCRYVGMFASVGHLNLYLKQRRRIRKFR